MTLPAPRLPRRRVVTSAVAGLGLGALPLSPGWAAAGQLAASRPGTAGPAAANELAAAAAAPGAWGDQGDGTYVNQIVPADLSDLDAIRVGGDYYAISSTIQYAPGMAVLHSTDLVNWSIISHAATDLTRIGPELNWDRMNRSGKGVWAGAIRH
ncbi:MAG TPA: family 43 glycosylhydrolase, partial [Catenuloplanes sp.]